MDFLLGPGDGEGRHLFVVEHTPILLCSQIAKRSCQQPARITDILAVYAVSILLSLIAMPIITISEHQVTEAGFAARVTVDHQRRHEVTVSDPFDEGEERSLEFYFEEWIQFPFDQRVRSERARDSIKDYGEALFEQVFRQNLDAYSDYREACRGGLTNLQIEIEGESPAFHALHWEARREPGQARPLAVDCRFTRKRFQQGGVGRPMLQLTNYGAKHLRQTCRTNRS